MPKRNVPINKGGRNITKESKKQIEAVKKSKKTKKLIA